MIFSHFTISQQGDSHIKTGKNCQDFSGSITVSNQSLNISFGIVAIADGVGSCDYSEDGSRIAVTTVLEELKKNLALADNASDMSILTILKSAYIKANDAIERVAETRELPFKLFDTTLTVTILTDSGICYVGHIGDDGAVALMEDGTYSMITRRIEGEEANSVIPLSSTDCWTFGVVKKPVAALVLLTDGLLDKAVGSERMHNRVYYPFFQSLFESIMETEEDVAGFRNAWDEYLHEKEFRDGYGVTDDITLALIQLPAILKNVKPVPFDEEKWNEESQKAKQEIEKALSDQTNQARPEEKKKNSPKGKKEKAISDHSEKGCPEEREEDSAQEGVPEEKTTYPKQTSQPVQKVASNVPVHNADIPPMYPSEPSQTLRPSQTSRRVQTSRPSQTTESSQQREWRNAPSGISDQDKGAPNKALRILIPFAFLVALFGVGFVFRNVGYNAGISAGKQQEQLLMREQLDELNIKHEQELEEKYEQGVHEAEALLTEKLQAEYERGYQDAERKLANAATDQGNAAQPPMGSSEQFVIKRGEKGEKVKTIQTMMIAKGWSIEADGIYGKKTEEAIREFQQLNSLPITGEVDRNTYSKLEDDNSRGKELPSQDLASPPAVTSDDSNAGLTNSDSSDSKETSESPAVAADPDDEDQSDGSEVMHIFQRPEEV